MAYRKGESEESCWSLPSDLKLCQSGCQGSRKQAGKKRKGDTDWHDETLMLMWLGPVKWDLSHCCLIEGKDRCHAVYVVIVPDLLVLGSQRCSWLLGPSPKSKLQWACLLIHSSVPSVYICRAATVKWEDGYREVENLRMIVAALILLFSNIESY